MNKLIAHFSEGESSVPEKDERNCFYKQLSKDLTQDGTLEALLAKTRALKEMHRMLHADWSYGHYELIRAVGYTLVNSSMSKPQRYRLIEAMAARERFLMRMSSYKGLFGELSRYYDICEKELKNLIDEKEPTAKQTEVL